ncbi:MULTISPECIES: MerR family transcriptional regulator [Persicobacter]|uniref:MerR family transcriptional regulator n=1 Tax=Persicobacter diffluens TaxID=981 RepID=A0AAN4VT05_9BACT|nr:MerR family transcriptional regulator [Persicobacter sp. CCB-QB2]GJM59579.1 MerR family transcriptional regulator [Persicobacter diffluens]
MSNYSIKDLELLSGIKAHTLRIWEQRYNFLKPQRTDTNIRYYTDRDLKLILNVSLLKENGLRISNIAKMEESEMRDHVIRITDSKTTYPEQIYALTLAMVELDEERFEKIMGSNILKYGFENTMVNIIYPFMARVGLLWQTGGINPAQEHFISNLVRQKLMVAIDSQYVSNSEFKHKYMLFLPDGELHDIGLLFANYLLRNRKNKTFYLGQSLPFEELTSIFEIHQPDFLLTIITSVPGSYLEVQKFVDNMSAAFPKTTILISGPQVVGQGIIEPENVIVLNKFQDLVDFIEEQE